MADAHKNFAISSIATAPTPAVSGTSLSVTTGHGTRFPTVPFNAVVCPVATDPDPTNAEVVRVTNIATDTLTITRAQESSSARTIVVGDRIYAAVTAKTLTDVERGEIHVKDYATGDGTTDDTAAFQSAVDAAAAAGKPLYVDPGYTYLLNGQVVIDNQRFHWIMPYAGIDAFAQVDAGSKILCGKTDGPCIVFGDSTRTLTNIIVEGLRVWAKADRYRQPMVQFGTSAHAVGYLDAYNLYADGGDFYTDAFLFASVYNGGIYSARTARVKGISFDVRCGVENVGNLGFYNGQAYSSSASGGGGVGWAINQGVPGNLLNSIKLDNCKVAGGPVASRDFIVATVAGTEAVGQTVITLSSATGINTNHWATVVAASGRSWTEKVSAVSGNDVTLRGSGIPFALASGDLMVIGNWHTVTGGGIRGLLIDIPHYEDCEGLLAAGVLGVEVRAPYLGGATGTHRGVYLAREAQQVTLTRPHATFGTPIPAGAALMHQANDATNQRNNVEYANKSDWPAFADSTADILRVDGGGAAFGGSRAGGVPTLLGMWRTRTTVAAAQTNIKMAGPNGTTTRYFPVPYRGVLRGLLLRADSGRSAGSITATVWINGVASSLTTTVNSATPWAFTDMQNPNVTLAAGDVIEVKWTTDGSWAPTSNALDAEVWVEQ